MAKNKRKTDKKKHHGHKGTSSKNSPADALLNKAKQSFKEQIGAARLNPNINKTIFEGLDYDPLRQRRRIQAVMGTLDQVKALVGDPQVDNSEVFTVESEWIDINAYPLAGYDLEERYTFSAYAAAIWILDQLKAADWIHSIEMEMRTGPDNELPMPPVWDICHSKDSIVWMMHVIYGRHGLINDGKANGLLRFYMTQTLAVERSAHRTDNSSAYEEILSYISRQAVEDAVSHYEQVYWDWVSRYFRSRIHLAQIEDQLHTEVLQLKTNAGDLFRKEHGIPEAAEREAMRNTVCVNGGFSPPLPLPERGNNVLPLALFGEATELQLRRGILEQSQAKAEQKIEDLWHYVGLIPQWPYEQVCKVFGEEIAEIWKDFDTGDPYEMAFAFLYLLDSGSDLPWCYFPGTNIHTACAGKLPWSRIRFNPWNDGIYYHFDKNAAAIKFGPADPSVPKRIKVPELENWYQLKYSKREEERPELYNLAQIMYEITGCIMPRQLDRYLPALKTLDKYGITGKRSLHTLLYCMTILGEARHKTDGSFSNIAAEEEPEQQSAQHQIETIESLQKQITDLKEELKRQKQMTYENGREARDMKDRYESLAQLAANESQELHDLRELIFHQQEGSFEQAAPSSRNTFPYTSSNRIVVFGGHESWSREIKPKLPNVRFVDRTVAPNANMIRNADVIWIQTNALCHPHFYKIVDEAKKANVPIRYFSYASPIKCAEQLVEEDRKMI